MIFFPIDPIYEKIKIANARQDTSVSHTSSHTYASVPSIDHGHEEGQLISILIYFVVCVCDYAVACEFCVVECSFVVRSSYTPLHQ